MMGKVGVEKRRVAEDAGGENPMATHHGVVMAAVVAVVGLVGLGWVGTLRGRIIGWWQGPVDAFLLTSALIIDRGMVEGARVLISQHEFAPASAPLGWRFV
jgi:hypothetical protein